MNQIKRLKKRLSSFTRSIQSKIFLAYGSIFLLLSLLVTSVYYFTSYQNFLENQAHTSRQLAKIVSSQVDQYLSSINSIQKRILESNDILNYIFEEAPKRDVQLERDFRWNVYSITGYDFDFYHINIYNLEDETLLTFGQSYDYLNYPLPSSLMDTLLLPVLEKSGAKYLTSLRDPVIYQPAKGAKTISMLRCFARYPLTLPRAVIEIQMPYERIEKLISSSVLSYSFAQEKVLIFDKSGGLIYPQDFPAGQIPYYQSLDTSRRSLFKNPFTDQQEMVASYTSKDSGFTAVLTTPEAYLNKNRSFFQRVSLLLFALSLVLLTFITYKVAKSISSPLAALKNRISDLELSEISREAPLPVQAEGFSEVEVLNEAYNRMQRRLQKSLEDIVSSRTLTLHSQLMALQAQMDSHFLYNTLTIISIIAEDNDDEDAAAMCVKLTEMLRYITEDYAKTTTFLMELRHTKNYTDLMSIRFGDQIQFSYHTDPKLDSLEIPRLFIQPVVENCVKYSRREGQTLKISIRTFIRDETWYAVVTDNGDGFSQEALSEIQKRTQRFDESPKAALSIDGMGLANIYLRLKLFYGEHFVFSLENLKDGDAVLGASITIGGTYGGTDEKASNPHR